MFSVYFPADFADKRRSILIVGVNQRNPREIYMHEAIKNKDKTKKVFKKIIVSLKAHILWAFFNGE